MTIKNQEKRRGGTQLRFLADYRQETGKTQEAFAAEVQHEWRGRLVPLNRATLALYETGALFASPAMALALAETVQRLLRARYAGDPRLSQIVITVDDLAHRSPGSVIHALA
jgi:DNA-binding XRE family transcriptional regulator